MKKCSKDVKKYHDEKVTLSSGTQGNMRNNRNANRDRLKRGLDRNEKPQNDGFVIQGSYAMRTMKQHKSNDYDIDDGVKFAAAKLVTPDGNPMTTKQAKDLVRSALIAGGGGPEKTPTVRPNCVRVVYAAGHHVDIPVYRVTEDIWGDEMLEIAGENEWRSTKPKAITEWFRKAEKRTAHPDEAEPQLRRLVRLLKMYSSHLGKESLSGLVLTILAEEQHNCHNPRDDEAFRTLLKNIQNRLKWNKNVYNPTDSNEEVTRENGPEKCEKLIKHIDGSLEKMEVLDEKDCTKAEARRVWDELFATEFFSKLQEDESDSKAPYTPSDDYPNKAVNIQGSGSAA